MATYVVDGKDVLHELVDIPQMEPGAPAPLILADEYRCVVAYDERQDDITSEESMAIVVFSGSTHYFGRPNDEALNGHPLYSRGLRSYAAYEVLHSSWIRAFERMNRVHPQHNPERFARLRHFIVTFHDSTFECTASGYEVQQFRGSRSDLLVHMRTKLRT